MFEDTVSDFKNNFRMSDESCFNNESTRDFSCSEIRVSSFIDESQIISMNSHSINATQEVSEFKLD